MQDTGFLIGTSIIRKRPLLKFITSFSLSVLIAAVIFVTIFYIYTYRELGSSHSQALLTLQGLRHNILPAIVLTGGIVVIFATLAILMMTLINSNKIAGPIYRLEKSFESIGDGDLSLRIKFRKGDAVNGLAEGVNSVSESLGTKISNISREMKEIRDEAERLRADPEQSTAVLMEKIRLAKKTVSEFKTE